MTAPNSVETFSPAGSGSLPASRSSKDRGGDSGGGSAAVKGREGAAVSEATAVEGLEDNSPAVCGREDSTAVEGREDDSTAVDGRDDVSAAVDGRDASRSVSPSVVV